MQTTVLSVDSTIPDQGAIAAAAALLRRDGLVAFPTETVYGLGANALDAAAVARIFAAKGRPATNPLIVHLADARQVAQVAADWPDPAARLAERFWPGPLTLVLLKRPEVPDIVTAGGPTVAARVPAHPVARALLRAAGVPVAAPSANRSTELSPTTAAHVLRGLGGRVDLILDAGPTAGGIESTVLDVTCDPPRLLRPGPVTPAEIEAVIGPISRPGEPAASAAGVPHRSPGQMPRHYAPRAPLELAGGHGRERVVDVLREGARVGWVTWPGAAEVTGAVRVELPYDPTAYAAGLYAALHDLDSAGVDRIVVARPPDDEAWLAIRDRLRRAAHP
jgi:L-threonylcarbamoyladenylate synthase